MKPFLGDSIGDLVIKLCIDPLPVATRLAPDLPPAVDALLRARLRARPEQRFPDAMALAGAFDAIVSGKPMKPVLPTASPLGSRGEVRSATSGSQAPRPPKLGAGAPAPPLAHSFSPVAPPTPASGSLLAPVSLTPPPDSGVSGGSSFRVRKQELGEVGQVVASERTGPNQISGPQSMSGQHAPAPSFVPTPPPSSTGASFAPGAWPPGLGPHTPRPPMPSSGTIVLPQGASVPSGTPPSGAMPGWNPGRAAGTLPFPSDVPHSPQPGVIDIADAQGRFVDRARPRPSSLATFARDLLEWAKRVDDGTRRRAAVVFASAITLLVVIFGLVSLFKGSGHEATTNAAATSSAGPEAIAPAAPAPTAEVTVAAPVATAAPAPAPAPAPVAPTASAAPSAAASAAPSAEDTDEPEASAPSAAPTPTWQRGTSRPKPSSTATRKKKPNFGY